MSLVFTFLYATNQAKALTLEGTFDFHKKLAGQKGTELEMMDKVEKTDLTEKIPKEDDIQAFASGTEGVK